MVKTGYATAGTGSLMKAFDVLDIVAASPTPLGVAEIAAKVGLPRPTTHRILNALLARGMVRREDVRNGFTLGYRLFELAHRAWSDVDVRGAAAEALDLLRDLSGEVVVLGVRKGTQFVCVDRRESSFSIRPVISVGYTEPLWNSALGMAILSDLWLDDSEVDLRDDLAPVFASPQNAHLLSQIPLNVARGYALMIAEESGSASVAAPILNTLGRPIAAIGIVGPTIRLQSDRLHQLALSLIDATRRATSNAGNVVQSIAPQPRPAGPPEKKVTTVADTRTLMGKAPIWHPRDGGQLFLSDAFGPSLIRISLRDGAVYEKPRPMAEIVGGLSPDGKPVVVNGDGVGIVEPHGTSMRGALPASIARQRLNIVAADRKGRLVLSVMEARGRTDCGALHRIEADGSITTLHTPLTMWSGLDWSPDGDVLYCADTARQQLLRFDYDRQGSGLSNRVALASFPVSMGRPDGVAVDSGGGIWVAMWDGWRLLRLTAEGHFDREVILPVPRPVGLCFGGRDLRRLYVTSARVRLPPETIDQAPLSGAVLSVPIAIPGLTKAPVNLR